MKNKQRILRPFSSYNNLFLDKKSVLPFLNFLRRVSAIVPFYTCLVKANISLRNQPPPPPSPPPYLMANDISIFLSSYVDPIPWYSDIHVGAENFKCKKRSLSPFLKEAKKKKAVSRK